MNTVALIRDLMAAGFTAEQALLAAEIVEKNEEAAKVEQRAKVAERVRRHRANKAVTHVTVTSDTGVTTPAPLDPPALSPTPPNPPPYNPPNPSVRESAGEAFEQFRKAYPKRAGSPAWKPAREKFIAAVKRGEDPEAIIRGAEAYARAVAGEDPRFVAMAATWLHQERWKDPIEPIPQKDRSNVRPFAKPDDGKAKFRSALARFAGRPEVSNEEALDGEFVVVREC